MDLSKVNTKKIKDISYWILLGLLLIILIFILAPRLPIKDNYSLRMVTSGSMRPTIKTGSIIVVRPASVYKIRDIITFQTGKGEKDVVTHRIIQEEGDQFVTQGDANNVADMKLVSEKQILGKMLFTVPYVGYLANFSHSILGFILFIVIPGLVIVVYETKKIIHEIHQRKSKDK